MSDRPAAELLAELSSRSVVQKDYQHALERLARADQALDDIESLCQSAVDADPYRHPWYVNVRELRAALRASQGGQANERG